MADYAVKQSKAKEDASIIARRRRMLQVFLNRLNRHPILSQDRVFLRFVDPSTTFAEIMHSPPVTLLPKNILRASSKDPTDTSMADMYNALPIPGSSSSLQDPDQRFIDSETFTSKFSAHLSGSLEKINRRLMKRWTELGADEADLGGLLNGFGLLEQNSSPDLAGAIEKTGQAIDSTYVHTNVMLQEWERLFTEPLAEYTQFSAIIKSLLKYRHGKHVQFEQTRDGVCPLVHLRMRLEILHSARIEADAAGGVRALGSGSAAPGPGPRQGIEPRQADRQRRRGRLAARRGEWPPAAVPVDARPLGAVDGHLSFHDKVVIGFAGLLGRANAHRPVAGRYRPRGVQTQQYWQDAGADSACESCLRFIRVCLTVRTARLGRQSDGGRPEVRLDDYSSGFGPLPAPEGGGL
jgi:hypothetical protein